VAIVDKVDTLPVWAWRTSIGLLTAVILATVGLLGAALAGVGDPRPSGNLTVDDYFETAHVWQISVQEGAESPVVKYDAGHYQMTVRAGTKQLLGTAPYEIHFPCTLELSAEQVDGQGDAGYGLWWGAVNQSPDFRVELNGNGYLAILPGDNQAGPLVRDWQLFPHVNPPGQINVLRVYIAREDTTVRLNDEIAGRMGAPRLSLISAGFFIQASQHGDVTVSFLSFRVWEEASPTH
jgi:hypothetical protein